MSKSGIVNVRMVITEEKILFNIEKVQKLINPKSKKQIVQLDDDVYFKDLIESIKTYLIEYPKKKNFPASVYRAAYGLVEYATNQFEENTKNIEDLIRQREQNISNAANLNQVLLMIENGLEEWEEKVEEIRNDFSVDIIDTINIAANSFGMEDSEYEDAVKLLKARINNLESNLHIEIDMERIEDRSKALSYIGIEVADALKSIPAPIDAIIVPEEQKIEKVEQVIEQVAPQKENTQEMPQNVAAIENAQVNIEAQQYAEETTFTAKKSLWQRIKESKLVKTIRYITKIRIKLDYSAALPEANVDSAKQ